MSSDSTPADTPGASAADNRTERQPTVARDESDGASGGAGGQDDGRDGAAQEAPQTPAMVESDLPGLPEPPGTQETPGPEDQPELAARPATTSRDAVEPPATHAVDVALPAERPTAQDQAATTAEGQPQIEAVTPLPEADMPIAEARHAVETPMPPQDTAAASVDDLEIGAFAEESQAGAGEAARESNAESEPESEPESDLPSAGEAAPLMQPEAPHDPQPALEAHDAGGQPAVAEDERFEDEGSDDEAPVEPVAPQPEAVRATPEGLAAESLRPAEEPLAARGVQTIPLAPTEEAEAPAPTGVDLPDIAEQPTWIPEPTYVEPPAWSEQPTYAEPGYPSLQQWSAAQVDSHDAAPFAPPEYAPPEYAPPVGYPGAAVYPTAAYAAPVYAPVYAPPAPSLRRRRQWPLILLTVAALAVVVALSLMLVANVFNVFGRSDGVTTLYSSAMTSPASDWPNDQECAFKGDGYHITNASNCYYSGKDYQDVTVSATAKLLKGDGAGAYGIAFRRPSRNKYYVFLVTGDGNWLVAKDNVSLLGPQRNSAIKTGVGAVNKLAVQMQGDHFTFFANGAQLGEVSDDAYASGKVGLAGDSSIEVAFKDFTVTQP